MNLVSDTVAKSPNPPKTEAYAKVRSQCVDSFARLELSIITLCGRTELKFASRALVGQRVKKLREPGTIELFDKNDQAATARLLEKAESLLRERTDIVHAEMLIAHTDGETMAIFRNSADLVDGRPEARIYSLKSLRALADDVSNVAGEINRLLAGAAPTAQSKAS
ncbi:MULTISPECIES: hypothetical protein [unclassified Novosphingobium]|uniref:hypothetical protein n=1 Tax=unclassified Novosphingobium TaxID=2644732 RepID=UPI0025E66AD5|nr:MULTISPECIES: hypothetical protein [unclassified Novosphingobium]HQV02747.1 hypothetical protein [Novosphingobium sp.]